MVSLLVNRFVNYVFPNIFVKPINPEQKIIASISKFFWDYILGAADCFGGLAIGCLIFICGVDIYYNYIKKKSSGEMGALGPAAIMVCFYLFMGGLICLLPIVVFRIIGAINNDTLEILDFGKFIARDNL
jgi:hypothetical protein